MQENEIAKWKDGGDGGCGGAGGGGSSGFETARKS